MAKAWLGAITVSLALLIVLLVYAVFTL